VELRVGNELDWDVALEGAKQTVHAGVVLRGTTILLSLHARTQRRRREDESAAAKQPLSLPQQQQQGKSPRQRPRSPREAPSAAAISLLALTRVRLAHGLAVTVYSADRRPVVTVGLFDVYVAGSTSSRWQQFELALGGFQLEGEERGLEIITTQRMEQTAPTSFLINLSTQPRRADDPLVVRDLRLALQPFELALRSDFVDVVADLADDIASATRGARRTPAPSAELSALTASVWMLRTRGEEKGGLRASEDEEQYEGSGGGSVAAGDASVLIESLAIEPLKCKFSFVRVESARRRFVKRSRARSLSLARALSPPTHSIPSPPSRIGFFHRHNPFASFVNVNRTDVELSAVHEQQVQTTARGLAELVFSRQRRALRRAMVKLGSSLQLLVPVRVVKGVAGAFVDLGKARSLRNIAKGECERARERSRFV
jgi:hypothetical protein